MKQYARLITLAGGILALFSFALPWEEDYSGVELANATSTNSEVGFVTIAFFASLVIIGTSLLLDRYTPWKIGITKVIVLISSCIALFFFVVLFFGERIELKIYGEYVDDIRYGAFLNAIGFILAIVGILDYPKTMDASESMNEQEDETNP